MPIFDGLGCVFVHIPKTAGTSITRCLTEHATGVRLTGRIPEDLQSRLAVRRNFFDHLVLRDYALFVDESILEQAFSFSVVRNPWDRLASLYRYRRMQRSQRGRKPPPDFPTWLERKTRPDSRDLAAVPQAEFLCDESGTLVVDAVCRFESLQDDWSGICERLGIGRAELPHMNRSASTHDRDLYTPATVDVVGERLARDIEAFGYAF